MKRMDWRVAATAIICIAALDAYAIYKGIDGALVALAVAAISGIAGFRLGIWYDNRRKD